MGNSSLLLSALLLLSPLLAAAAGAKDAHYHFKDGKLDHDPSYDQDSFLGKDKAKEFSEMDEKESVERLKKFIADEVDLDKDGFVTKEELEKHLEKVVNKNLASDVDKNWEGLNVTGDRLDWDTYARSLQPGLFDQESKGVRELAEKALEESKSDPAKISVDIPAGLDKEESSFLRDFFADLVKHRRRWRTADRNSDGFVTKDEYWSLLMPDEVPAMREVVAQETMESMDKDGDGRVSKKEMVDDLWKPKVGESEPEWLEEERQEFDKKKDANGDGYMDMAELRQWLQEPGRDGSAAEAAHLMQEADQDKDGRLSLEEVAANHELFAGSQATNYGSDIDSPGGHDEL